MKAYLIILFVILTTYVNAQSDIYTDSIITKEKTINKAISKDYIDHLYKSSKKLKDASTYFGAGLVVTGISSFAGLSLMQMKDLSGEKYTHYDKGKIIIISGAAIGTLCYIMGIINIGQSGNELELFHDGYITFTKGVGLKIKLDKK